MSVDPCYLFAFLRIRHFQNGSLANLITLGKVEQVDYDGDIPLVKVRIGELLTAWLPVLSQRAGPDSCWWPVEVGEQVVVLSSSGNLSQGVVLGSIHQQAFPASLHEAHIHRVTYADGAVIEYDRELHHLRADLPDGATVAVIASGGVSIIGDISLTGNLLQATGDITDHTRSMKADREIYNAHTHTGVQSGPSSTQTPNPSQ